MLNERVALIFKSKSHVFKSLLQIGRSITEVRNEYVRCLTRVYSRGPQRLEHLNLFRGSPQTPSQEPLIKPTITLWQIINEILDHA